MTGDEVWILDLWPFEVFDTISLSCMARAVREMADPVLVPPLHDDPVVLPLLTREAPLSMQIYADLALELMEATARALAAGVRVWPERASVTGDGLRLPAPSMPPGLGTQNRFDGVQDALFGVRSWLEDRLGVGSGAEAPTWPRHLDIGDPRALGLAVAAHASDPSAARARVEAWKPWVAANPLLDFDEAILAGEATLPALEAKRGSLATYVRLPLAAARHHRACVRWRDGDRAGARADVDRAIQLDAHARYLTTAALFAESSEEAARLHDAAVAAVQPEPPTSELGLVVLESGMDPTERAARDAARSHLARAVHRAKAGNVEGALADVRESLRRHPTDAARRWLTRLSQ